MLKRFLGALLACALVLTAVPAFADMPTLIPFRSSQVGYVGYVDSTAISNTGTANTYVADTTVSIILPKIRKPNRGALAVAGDSAIWFNWYFTPSGNSSVTVSGDSVYVQALVSMDGNNWAAITPGTLFYPDNEMPTSALYDGPTSVHLERGSTNNFYGTVKTSFWNIGPAMGATTAPTALQLAPYIYLKLVVIGDWGGQYQMWIKTAEDP